MRDSQQIIANTLSAWAGTATNGIIGFVLVPVLLVGLGKEGYGLTALVGTIVGLTVLVDLGLRGSLSRHLAEHAANKDERAFNESASSALLIYLVIASVCAAVCVFFAGPIARAFRVPGDLLPVGVFMIRWYASSMIVLGFVGPVFSGTIVALGRYDLLNTVGVLAAVVRGAGLVIVLRSLNGGLYGWAFISLGASTLGVIGNAAVAFRQRPSLRLRIGSIRAKALRPLFSLGGSLFTLQTTMVVSMQSDPIVITSFLGPGAVALYSPALALVSLFRPIVTSLSDQLSPFATVHHVKGEREHVQGLLISGTRFTMLMGVLASVFLCIFATPIMRVWLQRSLGAEYSTAAKVLMVWAVTDLGMYALGAQWAILLAMMRLSRIVWVNVILAAANIMLSVYLVGYTRLGVVGVVIPTALQRLLTWLIIAPYTAKLCGLTMKAYFVASYSRPLVVGALLSGAAFGLRAALRPGNLVELLTDAGLIVLTWIALSWRFGLTQEDRSGCAMWARAHFPKWSPEPADRQVAVADRSAGRPAVEPRNVLIAPNSAAQRDPGDFAGVVSLQKPNYYLWGWSGQLNTGDDAFLAVASWGLRKFMGARKLFMDSDISGVTSRQYHVVTTEMAGFRVIGSTRIRRWHYRRLSGCLVLAGGNLLADERQVDELLRGQDFHADSKHHTIGLGIGLGPFRSTRHEQRTRELLKRMSYVALRDHSSLEWAQSQQLGIPVIDALDLAVLLPDVESDACAVPNGTQPLCIGVSLLARSRLTETVTQRDDFEFARALGRATGCVAEACGASVKVLCLCRNPDYDDLGISRVFAEAFRRGSVEIVEHDGNPARTLAAVRQCTHCVSMRLHGSVLAYSVEVPFLSLEYHPKCREFARAVGLPEERQMDLAGAEFSVAEFQRRLESLVRCDAPDASVPLAAARTKALRNFGVFEAADPLRPWKAKDYTTVRL